MGVAQNERARPKAFVFVSIYQGNLPRHHFGASVCFCAKCRSCLRVPIQAIAAATSTTAGTCGSAGNGTGTGSRRSLGPRVDRWTSRAPGRGFFSFRHAPFWDLRTKDSMDRASKFINLGRGNPATAFDEPKILFEPSPVYNRKE